MIRINLLGEKSKGKKGGLPSVDFDEVSEQLKGIVNIATILSVIGIAVPQLVTRHVISTERQKFLKELSQQETKIQTLQQRERALAESIAQIDALNKQIEETQARVAAVERLISTRLYPVPVLDAVSQVIPKYAWLTDLTYTSTPQSGELKMEGRVLTNDILSDFLASLQEVPRFSKVQLEESLHQSEKEYDFKAFKINLVTKEGNP